MIKKNLYPTIILFLGVAFVGITSGYAFTKIFQTVSSNNSEIQDIVYTTPAADTTNPTDEAFPSSTTTTVSQTTNSTTQITLSELASHNSSNDCYVAYNGTVYNVTNNSSWRGCYHHGVRGGSDITSRFPHPTSYLQGIPVVGTLVGGDTTTTTNPSNNLEQDDDHDDDNYYEDSYELETEYDD